MNNSFLLAREIMTRPWAIDTEYANQIMPSLIPFLEKGVKIDSSWDNEYYNTNKDKYPDILTLSLKGEMFKNNTRSGRMGMREMGDIIQAADNDEKIKGIILVIDSPGGTVDGTRELVQKIAQTNKPVVGVVDGLAASAGYWIASACNHIISLDDFAKVGSIGVMMSFADMQPAYERMGVKFHEIYSSLSNEKNKDFEEIRKGNYENYRKETLDPLAVEFRNSVQQNRPLEENQLTGKTFFAKDVVGSMIDQIGSIEDAANFIYNNQANNQANNQLNNQTQKTIEMEKSEQKSSFWARIFGKKIGIDAQNEEEVIVGQDEKITKLQIEIASLQIDIKALNLEKQKDLAYANETKQQLDTAMNEIASLKAQPGATTATITKKNDSIVENSIIVSDDNTFAENLAAVVKKYQLN